MDFCYNGFLDLDGQEKVLILYGTSQIEASYNGQKGCSYNGQTVRFESNCYGTPQ